MPARKNVHDRAFELIRDRLGPASRGSLMRAFAKESEVLALPQNTTARRVLQKLLDDGRVTTVVLKSDRYGSKERVIAGEPDLFDLALSLKAGSYFSHGTAVFLHGLTNDVPSTIYVNKEQSAKPAPEGSLTQAAIDRAFGGKGRRSAYAFRVDELGEIVVLSGKSSGNLEVGTATTPRGRTVPTTKVERTLIDIAVRPEYAGGPAKVASAYASAVERGISANVLLATLKKLNHKYPYHQSIGFYLERAGADAKLLERLHSLGTDLDFYLAYGMKLPQFDKTWRIYFPEGL